MTTVVDAYYNPYGNMVVVNHHGTRIHLLTTRASMIRLASLLHSLGGTVMLAWNGWQWMGQISGGKG